MVSCCVCASALGLRWGRALRRRRSRASDAALLSAQAQGGEYKIHVGVNSVLVPVVVRDAHGRAIGDLTQKDFALFDQDKARAIVGFTVQKRAAGETQAPKVENGTQTVAPPPSITILDTAPRMPQRFIAFLFDDMHFEPAELLRIKIVATKILGQTVGDADMAAVVTTSGTSSGLTRDHAVLEGAVEKISPHSLYHSDPRACPPIDVFQADLIVNHHNMQAMDAAKEAYTTCSHAGGSESSMSGNNGQMGGLTVGEDEAARMVRTAAAQVLEVNDRDVAVTLSTVKEFVRRMGKLPGQQRTVILVSPGFLTVTPNATREKSEVLDLAARQNVTISALDARGLYTTNLDASQRGGGSAARPDDRRKFVLSQRDDEFVGRCDGRVCERNRRNVFSQQQRSRRRIQATRASAGVCVPAGDVAGPRESRWRLSPPESQSRSRPAQGRSAPRLRCSATAQEPKKKK